MDFRNLCSRFDMDSIKAKLPPLPALPQIRLPKSLPKLKSRKIFRSSREDLRRNSTKQPKYPITTSSSTLTISTPIQPSEFINRTPTRISTISALVQEHSSRRDMRRGALDGTEQQYNTNTYRSAHSIDDDDISFSQKITHKSFSSESLTENPTNRCDSSRSNETGSITKKTLSEKLQKGYKDISEFHFKSIISKKTVVRQDNIAVDYYAQRYNEDRYVEDREREQRDLEIADNYRFNFKESRQDSNKSLSVSPIDSPFQQIRPPENRKTAVERLSKEELIKEGRERTKGGSASEQSDGDESGMEITPPKRTAIEKIIFNRSPNSLKQRSLKIVNAAATKNRVDEPENYEYNPSQTSSLCSIRQNAQRKSAESDESINGRMRHKERMKRLTSRISVDEEDTDLPESVVTDNEPREQQRFTSQQSLNEKLTDNKAMTAIKQNFKRFKSSVSVKRKQQPTAGTETETQNNDASLSTDRALTTRKTTTDKLAARLNRFKSREASIEETAEDDNSSEKNKTNENSPIKTALSNKLQLWKKSFKKISGDIANAKTNESATRKESPKKQTRSRTLMKKVKNVRNLQNSNLIEDLDADDGLEEKCHTDVKTTNGDSNRKSSNLEGKFVNVRQRTLHKVNEKMQKMQVFIKSQENNEKQSKKGIGELKELQNFSLTDKKLSLKIDDDEQSSEESQQEVERNDKNQLRTSQRIHAAWTTKPILTDSTESEDNDLEYPRVLIHQDNSDTYESTLIISVTTAAPSSSPRASISEILFESATELPIERESNFNRDDETETKQPKISKDLLALPKTTNWIPNKDRISSFLEITPKPQQKAFIDPHEEGETSSRKSSIDSNSDSDSWIPEYTKNALPGIQKTSNSTPKQNQLNRIPDSEEPWKVLPGRPNKKLYKTKSIDIFAENVKRGGAQGAFEDFDDELKDEPVMKILGKSHCDDESYCSHGSGDDHDMTDDDNSSRITKVWAEDRSLDSITPQRSWSPNFIRSLSEESQRQEHIGNSRESLDANFDENDEYSDDDNDDYGDEDFDRPPSAAPSPPPSFSPPPPPLPQRHPPRRFSKPIIIETKADTSPTTSPPTQLSPTLPPLPKTNPPPLVTAKTPPKVPKRNESLARIAKPLVKTSSLRLTRTEQVKPSDVGKVNKLISRFEQPGDDSPLLPKKLINIHEMRSSLLTRHNSEYYSDQSDQDVDEETIVHFEDSDHAVETDSVIKEDKPNCNSMERKYEIQTSPSKRRPPPPSTPPPPPPPHSHPNKTKQHSFNEENGELIKKTKKRLAPQPSLNAMPSGPPNTSSTINVEKTPKQLDQANDNNISENFELKHQVSEDIVPQTNITVTTHQLHSERNSNTLKLTVPSDIYNKNIPLSQPNSEYGSPLEYPSSLISSAETTPTPDRKQDFIASWRNPSRRGRSLVKDEDQYFSFDSDEENSYYSISSAGSNRYVIEI